MGLCDPEYEQLDGKESSAKHYKKIIAVIVVVAVVVLVVVSATVGIVVHHLTEVNCNPSFSLANGITGLNLTDINVHLLALQNIANKNNGTRAVGTSGYLASKNYVSSQLGNYPEYFNVSSQTFTVQNWTQTATPTFVQQTPTTYTYQYGTEFAAVINSGSGTADGLVVNVGKLGCDIADFTGNYENNIALIQRGNCSISSKIQNAINMGAIGVIIINYPCFQLVAYGQINSLIPAILISSDVGAELQADASDGDTSVIFTVSGSVTNLTTWNVIADTLEGFENSTIVIGSHLDSVFTGPGINDNGSGSSINLALALQMARDGVSVENRIRFAWWGAEEEGLLGSLFYVKSLTPIELAQIAANINLDMIASPNFLRGIYNGSAATDPQIVNGSTYIQLLYTHAFEALGVNYTYVPFDGRSDYAGFISNGIPAGGVFTGAEEIKTVQGRATYGGLANAPYDPCYHQACDTYQNINQQVLQEMGNSSATVTYIMAQQPELRTQLSLAPVVITANTRRAFRTTFTDVTSSQGYQRRFNRI